MTARTALDERTLFGARELAQARLAPLPRRWAHTTGVACAAEGYAAPLARAGRMAVIAAAWLHDIGYAPSLVDDRRVHR